MYSQIIKKSGSDVFVIACTGATWSVLPAYSDKSCGRQR